MSQGGEQERERGVKDGNKQGEKWKKSREKTGKKYQGGSERKLRKKVMEEIKKT